MEKGNAIAKKSVSGEQILNSSLRKRDVLLSLLFGNIGAKGEDLGVAKALLPSTRGCAKC